MRAQAIDEEEKLPPALNVNASRGKMGEGLANVDSKSLVQKSGVKLITGPALNHKRKPM